MVRAYFEKLYTNKLDSLKEMDTLLEIYTLPRLNHEEIENLYKPIVNNVIELAIKNILTKKSLRLDDFPGEFY